MREDETQDLRVPSRLHPPTAETLASECLPRRRATYRSPHRECQRRISAESVERETFVDGNGLHSISTRKAWLAKQRGEQQPSQCALAYHPADQVPGPVEAARAADPALHSIRGQQ